jgi:hypothetical protein
MMKEILIELHYLPCIEYMVMVASSAKVQLEAWEYFQKQTYRNRAYILGAQKVECLVVPIRHLSRHQLIQEVEIDNSRRWQQVHWRTLVSAYNKAPFFAYYRDLFEAVYARKYTYLWNLNLDILTICRSLLKMAPTMEPSGSYQDSLPTGLEDLRNSISPDIHRNNYLYYHPQPYVQNFGREFVPNLSIVDLLFCEGNFSGEILGLSRKVSEQNPI